MTADRSNVLPSVLPESSSNRTEGSYPDIEAWFANFFELRFKPLPAGVEPYSSPAQLHFASSAEGGSYHIQERGVRLAATLEPEALGFDPAAGEGSTYSGTLAFSATVGPRDRENAKLEIRFGSEERNMAEYEPSYGAPALVSAHLTYYESPRGEHWLEFTALHPSGNIVYRPYSGGERADQQPSPQQAAAARTFYEWAVAQLQTALEPDAMPGAAEAQPSQDQEMPSPQNPLARFLGWLAGR